MKSTLFSRHFVLAVHCPQSSLICSKYSVYKYLKKLRIIDFSNNAYLSKHTSRQSIDWLTEIHLHNYNTTGGGQNRTPSRFRHYHSVRVRLNLTQYRVQTTIRLQLYVSTLSVHHRFRTVPFSEQSRFSGSAPVLWVAHSSGSSVT